MKTFHCEICEKDIFYLAVHLKKEHQLSIKDYYDKFMKRDREGVCENENCINETKFIDFNRGYRRYCCRKCSSCDPRNIEKGKITTLKKHGSYEKLNEKRNKTIIERYGNEENFYKHVKEKEKETRIAKYGTSSLHCGKTTEEIEEIKNKAKKTCLAKYGVDNPLKCDEVREKIKQTCLDKYGVDNPLKSNEIREKIKQTCLEKYGNECYSKTNEAREKIKNILKERYDVEWNSQLSEWKEEVKNTCLEKYGVEHYSKTDDFKKKYKERSLEKFGVDHPMQNHDIFCKAKKKYEFDGKTFDSKPEIAWFQKLKEYFTDFEYQPGIAFEYEFGGKTHRYFPDFKVGNVIYELKGAHFFKDGKMINPYDRNQDGLYEAKRKCMIQNGVKIIMI